MYSIKPGRGPSLIGAVGGVFAIVFGVFWMIMAARMGAPVFFVMFGLLFILVAIVGVAYNLYNVTARHRVSHFDITRSDVEHDPVSRMLGHTSRSDIEASTRQAHDQPTRRTPGDFCPYCGNKVARDYAYCPKCGKDI